MSCAKGLPTSKETLQKHGTVDTDKVEGLFSWGINSSSNFNLLGIPWMVDHTSTNPSQFAFIQIASSVSILLTKPNRSSMYRCAQKYTSTPTSYINSEGTRFLARLSCSTLHSSMFWDLSYKEKLLTTYFHGYLYPLWSETSALYNNKPENVYILFFQLKPVSNVQT